jgi:hypothetical protein
LGKKRTVTDVQHSNIKNYRKQWIPLGKFSEELESGKLVTLKQACHAFSHVTEQNALQTQSRTS